MTKKTNLLYVFADQWRYEAVGCNHADQVETPHMNEFAKESQRFSNAYSTYPLCSPHRASLMTGKYPFSVGMWTNCKLGLEEKVMLRPQEICIGDVLKAKGYDTGYIGKWHLDAPEQNFVEMPASGATEWDAFTPPGERRHGFDYWLSYGTYDYHLTPHYWMDDETQIQPGKWSVEFETDKALEFMEARKDQEKPFALFVSYNPPHLPYELVPDKYYEKYKDLKIEYRDNVPEEMRIPGGKLETQTRQYFAAVAGIDEQFGRICNFLKENGLEENTLVILSADHGDMMGSQGLMSKNVWYEESIHIPLMVRQKGTIPAGDNDVIFASPDHMPTVLDLLGLPVPETCQGVSHKEGIFGKAQNVPEQMFLCSYPGGADLVPEFEKLGLTHKAYGWRGIKTKNRTFVIHNGYHPGEEQVQYLYDDEKDPYQLHPRMIAKDCTEPEILKFREQIREYLTLTQDPFLMDR